MINFQIDVTGMDEILRRLSPARVPAALKSMVTGITRLLLRYSQLDAPVASGNLRRSGFMLISGDGLNAIVGFGTKYAGATEDGSRPHEIIAVNVRSLAFVPNSFTSLAQATAASSASRGTGTIKSGPGPHSLAIFPRHVNHPGTTANPFLAQGWDDSAGDASEFLAEVGSRYVDGDDPLE